MDLKLNKVGITTLKKYPNNGYNCHPQNSKQINFNGRLLERFQKLAVHEAVEFTNVDKIIPLIDSAFGNDKFFLSSLKKSNLDISNNKIVFPATKLSNDIKVTLKYPFVDLPRDIANSFLDFLGKSHIGFLKKSANTLSNIKILKSRRAEVEQQKSLEIVKECFSRFDFLLKDSNNNMDVAADKFKNKIAIGITDLSKNYNSRDERCLNRLATSLVSATFSGCDFYNISLLQKDNKEEAKKAKKARISQEVKRGAISAALTFISLGCLDKYIKGSVLLSAGTIAISSLISEVGSRLFVTPLYPLKPENVEEYKKKRDKRGIKNIFNSAKNAKNDPSDKTANTQKNISNDTTNKQNDNTPAFKGMQFADSKCKNIFSDFISQDGSFASVNVLKEESKKGGINWGKMVFRAFALATLFYLGTRVKNKKYIHEAKKWQFYKNNKEQFTDFLNSTDGNNCSKEFYANVVAKIKNANTSIKKSNRARFNAEHFLRTRKGSLNIRQLKANLVELTNNPDCYEIKPLLEQYIKQIDTEFSKNGDNIRIYKDIPVVKPVVEGISKMIKTLYQIFSLPGKLLNEFLDKKVFRESNKMFDEVAICLNDAKPTIKKHEIEDDLYQIDKLIKKYANKKDGNEKIVEYIKKNTRNIHEGSPDTAELAMYARTMVTLIGSYFFVNDYRNRVLIESDGKDVQGARREMDSRIIHRLSNFLINGTLMNLFNSVFATILNSGLVGSTAVATATEMTNETLVRKSICQPIGTMNSKQDIIDFEKEQFNKKGFRGWWSKNFMKLTGKKPLSEKNKEGSNKSTKA